MRRTLLSFTLASTVLITGCPGPNTPSEIDIQAATEQQAAQKAAMTQTVQAVAEGKVNNAISGTIEIPVDLGKVSTQLEPGTPLLYLHAFRATGEVIREAKISLLMAGGNAASFVVDNVPATEPIVLAATIEPGIVLRTVVPAASAGEPLRKQVINTSTEIVTQDLANLGVMPHVATLGLGSVLAQGGLDPAAAADANELAADKFEEFANTEWASDIPEARELAEELRTLAKAQREVAAALVANGAVAPADGNIIATGGGNIISTGGGNYSLLWKVCVPIPFRDPICMGDGTEEKRTQLRRKVQKKREQTPPPRETESVFQDANRLRQIANQSDLPPAADVRSPGAGGSKEPDRVPLRIDGGGGIFDASGKLIGHAGGNLIGHAGGNVVMDKGGNLYNASGRLIGHAGGNIIATGGGNIIGHAGGNIIATGGGNIIATGGGNIIATGGGNIISTGGGNIISTGGGNIISTGGGNIISTGGGNIIAAGGGNIISTGGGNMFYGGSVRTRLTAVEDALALENEPKVALNGDPFTASEIDNFLRSGKNPYRSDCSQIDFDSSNTSCRVVVSPKGVQEVLVTRRAKTLEAYIAELNRAWENDDVEALDRLFKENPALVNFVEQPNTQAWQNPLGTWRMRVIQMRGNDELGKEFVLVNDSEVKIEQKGESPTMRLPSGPVSANFSMWFNYGAPTETTDVLNNFIMKFDWEEDGRYLKNGLITGENRQLDGRSRKLYNATFTGQMQGVTRIEGLWYSGDGQTSGMYQMIRGTERYTVPMNQ